MNPRNKDVYFTDTLYGYLQDFRPTPGMRNQVYRLNDVTGAVTVVADGFTLPNGESIDPFRMELENTPASSKCRVKSYADAMTQA